MHQEDSKLDLISVLIENRDYPTSPKKKKKNLWAVTVTDLTKSRRHRKQQVFILLILRRHRVLSFSRAGHCVLYSSFSSSLTGLRLSSHHSPIQRTLFMVENVEQSPPTAALYVLNKVRVSLKRVQTALYPRGPLRKQIVLHWNDVYLSVDTRCSEISDAVMIDGYEKLLEPKKSVIKKVVYVAMSAI